MWTAGTDRPLEDVTAMMVYVVKFQNNKRTDCLKHNGRRSLGIDTQGCSWVSTLTWTTYKCIYLCMQTHTENMTQQNTNLSIFNNNFSFLMNIFFALWDYAFIHPSFNVLPGELKHFFLSPWSFESPEREKIQGKGETRRSSQLRSYRPDSNPEQDEDKAFHNSFFCVFYTRWHALRNY